MAKNTVTPLGRRVLVKRTDEASKTDGGIYIPDNAQEKSQKAEVLALGTGKDDEGRDVTELFSVKIGDTVLISKYGGTEVKLGGQDVVIINETDILGVLS